MDTASLTSFVQAAQKPIVSPTELERDATTTILCLSNIQYQISALANLAAKHGVDVLADALGDELSPLAKSIFTSFGKDWEAELVTIKEAKLVVEPIEEIPIKEEKPIELPIIEL